MENQKEKFKEIIRRYWKAEQEVREYRRQFLTIVWDGNIVSKAKKSLNAEEVRKLKEIESRFENVRREYIEALNNLPFE